MTSTSKESGKGPIHYVAESAVKELVDQSAVTAAIGSMYEAMARGEAVNFPVVRETLGYADAIFGFKSGFDRRGPVLGVKAGGLWPANASKGLPNHQSTIVLFDPDHGGPLALIRGTWLTALRTAAASALSIRYLARADAKVLGILGAGGQSLPQVRAALAERDFREVLICDCSSERAAALADALVEADANEELSITCCTAQKMASCADVIITVTPSWRPIVRTDWVRPGTHLACMGADTAGKQEVESALVASASLFGDEPRQAVTIGECQHAFREGCIDESAITPIGQVIGGEHPGRREVDEITLFDSTGVGLQDLVAARLALDRALAAGRAIPLD